MTVDMKKRQSALELRKAMRRRSPTFARQDQQNWKRLKNKGRQWRRPRGSQSKLRKQHHGHGSLVKVGYGTPSDARGVHRSGLMPITVHNEKELVALKKTEEGAVIASTVGMKKRVVLAEVAKKLGISIINLSMRNPDEYVKNTQTLLVKRVADRKARAEKRKKVQESAAKKAEKPAAKTEKAEAKPGAASGAHAHEQHSEQKDQEKKEFDKVLTKRDV